MTARLQATLLAAALFIGLTVALFVQPTGYSLLSAGPTVDVLGNNGDNPIVTIKGHESYSDDGQLRMLTVYEMPPGESLSLASAVRNWLSDSTGVYPTDFLYPPGTTNSSNTKEGAAEMTSAQDLAKAAALRQAGIPVTGQITIGSVDPAGPSNGKIKVGDILLSVNGKAVTTPEQGVAAVRAFKPGDVIPLVVQRGSTQIPLSITAGAVGTSGDLAKTARIGVGLASAFKFPFEVNINIPDNIMGPSAGMMFALTIYDKLTPGSLTKGHTIAGTGTIDGDGKVGAIGGIDQKIQGAQRDGAQLFLAPASNCDEVVRAHYNHATMRVVKVSTLSDAIKAIESWTANPNAALPGCS